MEFCINNVIKRMLKILKKIMKNLKMEINYGIENLRFGHPVLVNSDVRLKAKLVSIANLRGVTKANIGAELEIIGQNKPAFKGEVVFLYHFEE